MTPGETVEASETYWRSQLPNYDLVLAASGILQAVRRRPDGTRPDAALFELIMSADDPAKTAYNHALVRLSQQGMIPCVVCGQSQPAPRPPAGSRWRRFWNAVGCGARPPV